MCFCFSHIWRLKDFRDISLRTEIFPRCRHVCTNGFVYDAQHFSELIKMIKMNITGGKLFFSLIFFFFFPSVINFTFNLTAHHLKCVQRACVFRASSFSFCAGGNVMWAKFMIKRKMKSQREKARNARSFCKYLMNRYMSLDDRIYFVDFHFFLFSTFLTKRHNDQHYAWNAGGAVLTTGSNIKGSINKSLR